MSFAEVIIADTEAFIKLSLWDQLTEMVETECTYSFTNLSVRDFGGNKSLTTTPFTVINEVEEQFDVIPDIPDINTTIHNAEIVQIKSTTRIDCKNCTAPISRRCLEESTFRCEKCHMRQKSCNVAQTVRIQINLSDNNEILKLTAFNDVLLQLFQRENFKLEKTTTDDEVEEFILNLDHFNTVTYNNDKVIVQLM